MNEEEQFCVILLAPVLPPKKSTQTIILCSSFIHSIHSFITFILTILIICFIFAEKRISIKMSGKNNNQKSSPLSKKVAIFVIACFAYYIFFGSSSSSLEAQGPLAKEWLKAPKVLSKSMSEQELDKFPADAFSYIAMIDVS